MNTITPQQFFAAIFPQPLEAGQLMVWSKIRKSGKTATDWCFDLDQAGHQVERYRRTRDVYFGVALQDRKTALARARRRMKRAAPSRVRGSEESVTALPALWAELGVAGIGPAQLEALPQRPSIVVSTGTALQAYWLLNRLWVLEEEAERRRAKHLLGKIRWALASAGAARRPAAAPVRPDLADLMPVAGTFREDGRRCRPIAVVRLPESGSGRRYAPEDFADLEDPPQPGREPPPWVAVDSAAVPEALDDPEADFRRVWRGCSWIRHCHRHQATLPEREWVAALSIVGRARAGSAPAGGIPEVGSSAGAGGRRLAHAFSARHPGYAPELTDRTLERALAGEPATCRRIGRALEAWGRHCCRCGHQGRIESPIVLGAGDHSAPRLSPATPRATLGATALPAARVAASAPAPAAGEGDGEEPLDEPVDGGRPEVEIVVRISPRAPGWTSVLRALIAVLERSIPRRGDDGESGGDPPAGRPEPVPRTAVPRTPVPRTAVPAPLIDGLEQLLATLGGEGTSRQMVEALAAARNRDRFGLLRTALSELIRGLDGGVPTARQVGCLLASFRGRSDGRRTIVCSRRSRKGMTWMVGRTKGMAENE